MEGIPRAMYESEEESIFLFLKQPTNVVIKENELVKNGLERDNIQCLIGYKLHGLFPEGFCPIFW